MKNNILMTTNVVALSKKIYRFHSFNGHETEMKGNSSISLSSTSSVLNETEQIELSTCKQTNANITAS